MYNNNNEREFCLDLYEKHSTFSIEERNNDLDFNRDKNILKQLNENKKEKIEKQSKKVIILKSEFIVYKDGTILRKMKSGKWKKIKNHSNHNKGYNVVMINKKQYTRSQIIAYVYLNYDLMNNDEIKKTMIIHKDKNKINCNVKNLKIIDKNYFLNF